VSWIAKILGAGSKENEDNTMKYLIIGLGNIGADYSGTRHNIGFDITEALVEELGGSWKDGRFGRRADCKFRGRTIHILQPDTFMNLSGKAAKFWLKKLGVTNDRMLIITDDLNLPLGKLRLKTKGGSGGHNGLKSMEMELGNSNYPRLRVGIGSDFSKGQQVDFVLGRWSGEEIEVLEEVIPRAVKGIQKFCYLPVGQVMTELNR